MVLQLEQRVEQLEKDNRSFFLWGFYALLGLNFFAMCKIVYICCYSYPLFEKMFVELLAGESLPEITLLFIRFRYWAAAGSVLSVVTIFFWGILSSKNRRSFVPVFAASVLIWIIQMSLTSLGTKALYEPFMVLIKRLG